MYIAMLEHPSDFPGWRTQARHLLDRDHAPECVTWQVAGEAAALFSEATEGLVQSALDYGTEACIQAGSDSGASDTPGGSARRSFRVPRRFPDLAERVVCHRDPQRFALLYRVVWRLNHGEPDLLDRVTDDDVHTIDAMARAVSRDRHKMTAFLRFRLTPDCEQEHYSAWFEPSHHILRLASDFFCKRFSNMDWSIYTPEGSAHWNRETLVFGPPGRKSDLPAGEAMEALWRTYFSSTFNPARLRLDAMRAEMPVKYWKNLPEAPLIAKMVHQSGWRTEDMVQRAASIPPRFAVRYAARSTAGTAGTTAGTVTGTVAGTVARSLSQAVPQGDDGAGHELSSPVQGASSFPCDVASLDELRDLARQCERCPHACNATQTVFGHGNASARIVLVGEQPGDVEDIRGRPFVGPAGKLIRSILGDLGVDQDEVYFTNAVKHFKYTVRGKRRLHQKPSTADIEHCRPWLVQELKLVKPQLVVALGSTAARSLLQRTVRIEQERGTLTALRIPGSDRLMQVLVTGHPAGVLRSLNAGEADRGRERLLSDIAAAVQRVRADDRSIAMA